MKYRRSRLTPEFKLRALAALDARNGDIQGVAQEFDVAPKTLMDWRRQRQFILQQTEEYQRSQQAQRSISTRIEMVMNYILDSLPSKVDASKLGEAVRIFSELQELQQDYKPQQEERISPMREKLASMIAHFQAEAESAQAARRATAMPDQPDDADDDPDPDFDLPSDDDPAT